jgi:oligopeptide/dipeptide ABC transporter ATP-binding protein
MDQELLVDVRDLVKVFPVRGGFLQRTRLTAVDHVSLTVARGETLGLVGESGSGKSTIANVVAGLSPRTSGTVIVNGVDFSKLRAGALRQQRRHVQMVFQDPYTSLAPTSTVESSILEPLRAHNVGDHASRSARVDELLAKVQLDRSFRYRYRLSMSGGQLQRASIARALALEPQLLVLDEPVSALDVSTKAEIINLLADLKDRLGLSYLFISHDLSTLRVLADRLAVMYLGKIVEHGPAGAIYDDPKHPYTRALLGSVPVPDPVVQRSRHRIVLGGDIPSPLNVPSGCSFHTRCPNAMPQCSTVVPVPVDVNGVTVSCHLYPAPDSSGDLVTQTSA